MNLNGILNKAHVGESNLLFTQMQNLCLLFI